MWLLSVVHLFIIVASGGCGGGKPRTPAIGEAYVAPMTLNLRQELSIRAPVIATVKHGDRLEILERRRRFVKVRTDKEEEGWTDSRQLLSPQGMSRLRSATAHAARLPSQGKVSPFDKLNVHIEANRQSPSFYQLPEKEWADMVNRAVTPRVAYAPDPKPETKKEPPKPETRKEGAKHTAGQEPVEPLLKDDWTLVRLKDGRSGWVLSRMLMLGLPDEVTQYAEGHRITSFFPVGEVEQHGQKKHHWLWTTISVPPEKFQFDSVRLFVWSTRRHRYETAYRESRLQGYFPTTVEPTESGARFSIIAAGKDGVVMRRTYEFNGAQVKIVAREPYTIPSLGDNSSAEALPPTPQPTRQELSRWESMKHWVRRKWGGGKSD